MMNHTQRWIERAAGRQGHRYSTRTQQGTKHQRAKLWVPAGLHRVSRARQIAGEHFARLASCSLLGHCCWCLRLRLDQPGMPSNCGRSSWPVPFEPALGEHLELRGNQLGSIEAPQLDKHEARKTLQVVGEKARPACRTDIPVETFAGIGNIMKRRWVAADEREVFLRHTEERRHFAARCFLAVEAMKILMNSGSLSNSNFTAPQAHRPVYFFVMRKSLLLTHTTVARLAGKDRFIHLQRVDELRARYRRRASPAPAPERIRAARLRGPCNRSASNHSTGLR